MNSSTSIYKNPPFEPTVDEYATLKKLELSHISVPSAIREHLSGRLYEHGYIQLDSDGQLAITASGRELIRRQDSV